MEKLVGELTSSTAIFFGRKVHWNMLCSHVKLAFGDNTMAGQESKNSATSSGKKIE